MHELVWEIRLNVMQADDTGSEPVRSSSETGILTAEVQETKHAWIHGRLVHECSYCIGHQAKLWLHLNTQAMLQE